MGNRWKSCVIALALGAAGPGVAPAFDVVLNAQGEFLDAYLIDGSSPPRRVVFIDPDPADPESLRGRPPRGGRHVNGKLCFFPKGVGHDGQFIIADDAYREACLDRDPPQARCGVKRKRNRWYLGKDPDGWAVFRPGGAWTKLHVHAEWDFSAPEEPQGNVDPQGCAFDAAGNFWGTDVGHGEPGAADGSLLVFFPGKRKRYDTYCFVDKALGAPGMPVMDDAGNLYVPEPAAGRVTRFSPPFPASAADCDNPERLVTTPPTKAVFLSTASGLATPASIARVPGSDHFYVGSVLIPATIVEVDAAGAIVRTIVASGVPRNPLGLDVGADGTIYYAELNLDPQTFGTRCGSMARVRFDATGQPLPPEQIGRTLRFPDGVTVVDSRQLKVDFAKLPPATDIDPAACGGE